MPINAAKPHLWKADVARSVDLFNAWFMECAPAAYRNTRVKTTEAVKQAMEWTTALRHLDAATLMLHPVGSLLTDMEPGTFALGAGVLVRPQKPVRIPIDVMIRPKTRHHCPYPIMIEVKAFGTFAIARRQWEEDAAKIQQLRETYGESIQLILFLAGCIDASYLGYTAAEGLDWVWEHRIEDLLKLGL